jgi:15-cis-phytoene synthase
VAPGVKGSDAGPEVVAAARAGEPDRYLAALLAPAPQREALLALAALAAELAHIPQRVVREPIMGDIRLEWWRKALVSADGDGAGHAVAEAMRTAIERHDLPVALIDDMLDARALELMPAPFPDDAAVQDFLWRTEGALFRLGGCVAGVRMDGETEAACRAAGQAYGLTRLILGLPRSLSLGRVPLAATQVAAAGLSAHELLAGAGGAPVEVLMRAHFAQIRGSLADARRLVARLPRQALGAFLPLALVHPYVRQLERQLERQLQRVGGGAVRAEVQIVPLTRVWRIARAHVLGRL